jgi:hypothetical protein
MVEMIKEQKQYLWKQKDSSCAFWFCLLQNCESKRSALEIVARGFCQFRPWTLSVSIIELVIFDHGMRKLDLQLSKHLLFQSGNDSTTISSRRMHCLGSKKGALYLLTKSFVDGFQFIHSSIRADFPINSKCRNTSMPVPITHLYCTNGSAIRGFLFRITVYWRWHFQLYLRYTL